MALVNAKKEDFRRYKSFVDKIYRLILAVSRRFFGLLRTASRFLDSRKKARIVEFQVCYAVGKRRLSGYWMQGFK